jgi:putative colanic acid biosynthesis acetyltransferase WcaF
MEILDARTHRPLEGGPTFPRKFLVIRTLWNVTWLLLGSWTPPPLFGWRRILLRSFGAKISPTALVYGSTRIWYPANVKIGNYVQIGPRAILYSMAKISLEDYVFVSQGAHLCAGAHDIESPDFQTVAKPIQINARVWVAAEAFVGPGVTVGEGAVLGARGVAFRDLEPWTVYAGNPAKPIKTRNVRFDKTCKNCKN